MHLARTLAFAALLVATGPARAEDAQEKAAVAAADAWLKLVDAGSYGASWDEAASFFRNAIARTEWEKAVKAVRPPLGKVVSRKVASRTYTESVPGAPDGKYVIVQYETSFEKKRRAVETVTPMLDADGRWRVSGYFVK
jgi:hypothetical protein